MADAAQQASPKRYAVVSYIPALHRGYIDFFKKYPGTLYILSASLLKETPRLERDIRALAPEEIKSLLEGLRLFEKIVVLDEKNLAELRRTSASIIMPDEDANRSFAETHLADKLAAGNIEFVKTFLRWDRHNAAKAFQVSPDRTISNKEFDREVMGHAFKEAEMSPDWWRQIGAAIVKDGEIISASRTTFLPSDYVLNIFGDPRSNFDYGEYDHYKSIHSEAKLIAEAARNGVPLKGANLYVTTFPCPACAKLIVVAGIDTLYYAEEYSSLDSEDILKKFGVKLVMVK